MAVPHERKPSALVDSVDRETDRRLRAAAWRHCRRINPKAHIAWGMKQTRMLLEGDEIGSSISYGESQEHQGQRPTALECEVARNQDVDQKFDQYEVDHEAH